MQVYKQDFVRSALLQNEFSRLQARIVSLQAGFRTQCGFLKRVFKSTRKNRKSTSRIPYAFWFLKTHFEVYKQEMQVYKQDAVDGEVLKYGFSSLQARIVSLQAGFRTQSGSLKRVFKSTSKNWKYTSRIPCAVLFF